MFQASFGKNFVKCSEEVMRLFMTYPWPGNVRELKYALEHACILCPGGEITLAHLPADLLRFNDGEPIPCLSPEPRNYQRESPGDLLRDPLRDPLRELGRAAGPGSRGLTREGILQALAQAGDNRAKAARLLGVDRRTLYRNMDRLAIK
jgi:DNA-binding NtrC family response regulator